MCPLDYHRCVFVFRRHRIANWWLENKQGDSSDNIWSKIFKLEEFAQIGMIGSHSIRNFAATHARRCVELKDEKDIQGRWKGKGQVSDVYNDVELPYPDCKVAEKLAMGGPVST